jgi:hypothetical protein
MDTLGSKSIEVPMHLEDHGFHFDKAPRVPRHVESLVTMKLDALLCQPTGLPWKLWFRSTKVPSVLGPFLTMLPLETDLQSTKIPSCCLSHGDWAHWYDGLWECWKLG